MPVPSLATSRAVLLHGEQPGDPQSAAPPPQVASQGDDPQRRLVIPRTTRGLSAAVSMEGDAQLIEREGAVLVLRLSLIHI